MAQTTLIHDDMVHKRLVRVHHKMLKTGRAYYFVYSPSSASQPKVANFTQWLREEVAEIVKCDPAQDTKQPVGRERSKRSLFVPLMPSGQESANVASVARPQSAGMNVAALAALNAAAATSGNV